MSGDACVKRRGFSPCQPGTSALGRHVEVQV